MKPYIRFLSKSLLAVLVPCLIAVTGWTQPSKREQAVLDTIAQISITQILIQGLVKVCDADLDALVPDDILISASRAANGRLQNLSALARFEGIRGLNQLVFPKTGNLHHSMEIAVEEMSIDSNPDVSCDLIYDILKQQYDESYAAYDDALTRYRERR